MSLGELRNKWQVTYQNAVARFHDWWSPLEAREKKMVTAGSLAISAFIFYAAIFMPLSNHAIKLRKQIKTNSQLLAWMQEASKKINAAKGEEHNLIAVPSPVVLLTILQQKVDKAGLASGLTELKQVGNDSVEMQFKQVEFDNVMRLLIAVLTQHDVKVEKLTSTARATPGIVDANLVFKI